MHSSETRPGGRYLAIERGAIPDEPLTVAAQVEDGTDEPHRLPLFPFAWIAHIGPKYLCEIKGKGNAA